MPVQEVLLEKSNNIHNFQNQFQLLLTNSLDPEHLSLHWQSLQERQFSLIEPYH